MRNYIQVRTAQQASAMVQSSRSRELIRRTRDFQRLGRGCLIWRGVRILWVREIGGSFLALVQHDVMALVDAGSGDAVAAQGADDHFGVLVAGEDRRGADDGPVYIAFVVEDCAAAAAATDDVDWGVDAGFWEGVVIAVAGGGVEEGEVHF